MDGLAVSDQAIQPLHVAIGYAQPVELPHQLLEVVPIGAMTATGAADDGGRVLQAQVTRMAGMARVRDQGSFGATRRRPASPSTRPKRGEPASHSPFAWAM